MGRESELFKAAQSGNVEFLERAFSSFLSSSTSSTSSAERESGRGRGKKQSSGVSLRKGSSPNMQDEQGYTLLHHASLNGHCETVSLLLRCGASTTIPDCSGSGPLHLAAWKGDLPVVMVLISQGPSRANVNQQNDTDNTPLHLAAQYGYSNVVEFLLQRHADPMLHNCQGEMALDLAAQYGHLESVHLLISHCPELLSISRGKFSPLHLAARNGHTLVALSLINAGVSVNIMGEHGTPLHEAALFGKPEMVKMLLDKGASSDLKDRASKSVLDSLKEFPAERAREILKIIQDHKEERDLSGVAQHVVAVATTGSPPVNGVGLEYRAGDHISVVGRRSEEMFEGALNGRTGTFSANDVVFHKEVGGQLIPVENPVDIFPATDGHAPSPPPPLIPMKTYKRRCHTNLDQHPPPPPAPAAPAGGESVRRQRERHQSVPETMKLKKFSKKEKRFQLSKDDGAYCELSAIDPVSALKSDTSGNIRFNPVGPAFSTSLPGQPNSSHSTANSVTTSHNGPSPSVAKQPDKNEEFLGSYYVLEVGNFSSEEEAKGRGGGGGGGGKEEEGTYSLLDAANIDKDKRSGCHSNSGSYENVTSSSHYQNVEVKKAQVKYENISVKRCHGRQKSSPMVIPSPEKETVVDQRDTTVVRRMSTSLPVAGSTVAIDDRVNTATPPHQTPEVKGRLPRQQSRSRDGIYEVTSVNFASSKKRHSRSVSDGKSTAVSGTGSDTMATATLEQEHVKNSVNRTQEEVEREEEVEEEEEEEVEEEEEEEVEEEEEKEKEEKEVEEEPLTKMIEQNGQPFAGLVITSSVEEGGGGGGGEKVEVRKRSDTLWDDSRVQQEWNQIDSLLNDMRGDIDNTTVTTSLTPRDVPSWLSSVSMEKYIGNLETNGFDSLQFLGGGLLISDDLKDIGITHNEDRLTLQATSHLLPPPPSLGGVASVVEWLEFLQLPQLEVKFNELSLQKISHMWDIELCSVVGVELLGHRRRLLYGISELCRCHPEWSTPATPPGLHRDTTPIATPTTPSLFKDYTSIQPSPQQLTPPSPIELRPPLESQGGGGGANSRPHSILSSRSSWRHSVDSLVDETVNYEARYLGSVIVVRVRGKQSTEEACLRLRTSTEQMQKLPLVILSVSWKNVKFIDGVTKVVVSTHSIQDISYCSLDIEDKRVFAYISKDRTGMYYSHVFMATDEVMAEEILLTIGQAFEIAYQKVQKVRVKLTPPRNSN